MTKDVMIRVTCVQRDEKGQSETVSLETPGRFGERGGVPFLTYEETEITGMAGTRTSLFFRRGGVDLVRTGKFLQKQEYRMDEETASVYPTPLGPLDLRVRTKEIENTVCGGSGRLRIVYDVELKGFFSHVNELVVDVWEEQGLHGSQG